MFFGNLFKSVEFGDWVRSVKSVCGDCSVRKGKNCKRCGLCCHVAPGALAVEDFEPLAKHFGISVGDLVRQKLTLHDNAGYLVPIPLRRGQEDCAGRYLDSSSTFDTEPCIFLTGEPGVGKCSCSIYAVRPYGCRLFETNGGHRHPPQINEDVLVKLGFNTTQTDTDYEDDDYDSEEGD